MPEPEINDDAEKPKWQDISYDECMNGTFDMGAIDHQIVGGKKIHKQSELIKEFMKVLSLAHSCVAEYFQGKIFYNGISPDEVALVEFAASMGFECTLSNDTEVQVKFPEAQIDGKTVTDKRKEVKFEVIKRMNFTSDRKRMSILVRDPTDDNAYKLFIKGADSVVQERLINSDELPKETEEFLNKASLQGLRTLLLGVKVVDKESVDLFLEECDEAARDLKQKDKKLEEIYSRFETDFTLLGGTAVEDRL